MSVAVLTMVYDDYEFLEVWLRHWRAHLEERSLYVLVHGPNERLEDMAAGCNVIRLARPAPYTVMEHDRWRMISHIASGLSLMHDVVMYNDVDEIVVLSPDAPDPGDLERRLETQRDPVTAPMGVEIIHRPQDEPDPIDLARPILGQRRFMRGSCRFSKPSIVKGPHDWRRGGHYIYADKVTVDPHLYNFHLRYFDMGLFRERALSRRATTKAPAGKNNAPGRAWRQNDDALDEHIAALSNMPIQEDATGLNIHYLHRPMLRRGFMAGPEEKPFLKYPLPQENFLRVLPESFRELF